MIKLRTMHELYNTALNYKIQEYKTFIQEQLEKVDKYLFKVNEVAPILSKYLNYNDVLNGKVSSLPDEILQIDTTEIKYANMVLKNYYELRQPIETASKELKEVKKEKISYTIYKEIISLHNRKVTEYLLETGKTFENKYFGTLKVYYRENVPSIVNWGKSNENKKKLLEQGLIPYKKEDEDKALAEGKEYKGVKWLVMGFEKGLLVLKWSVPPVIKEHLNKDMHDFKFIPARGNYGIMKLISDTYLNNFNPTKYEHL